MNDDYMRLIRDRPEAREYNLLDFMSLCEALRIPFYEVEVVYNPNWDKPIHIIKRVYDSAYEYMLSMPTWAGMKEDEDKRAVSYYPIPDIKKGEFSIKEKTNFSEYEWHFFVKEKLVAVLHTHQITAYSGAI